MWNERSARWLQNLRELLCENTTAGWRRMPPVIRGSSFFCARLIRHVCVWALRPFSTQGGLGCALRLAFRRLGRIGTQQPVFQWGSVESSNNRTHLFLIWCFDKSESLGFLRFGVTNHLDRISDQVVCGKPRLDIVGRHPDREISEEYRKTHSLLLLSPFGEGFLRLASEEVFLKRLSTTITQQPLR